MSGFGKGACAVLVVLLAGCSESPDCVSDFDCEPGKVCRGQVCTACEPDCEGRCCGNDGCGGACADTCTSGLVCDPGSCTCEQEPCVPHCEGCCGDDGCGGDCADTCTSGYACDRHTCTCEPCTPRCNNRCCGSDGCGGTCSDTCSAGKRCNPATCWCVAPGEVGSPCPVEDVYTDWPACGEDLVCYGAGAASSGIACPGGVADCVEHFGFEWSFNPICQDGYCGLGMCLARCRRLCGDCPEPFESHYSEDFVLVEGERCLCLPPFIDGHREGGCTFGPVNPCDEYRCMWDWACMGIMADGEFGACEAFWDCRFIPPEMGRDCVDGSCGGSFCSPPCEDGACEVGYFPYPIQDDCYCIPTSPRDTGEPCAFGSVNESWGSCREGLTCVGMVSELACPGGIPDCLGAFPESWNPACTFDTGLCGASFCAQACGAGETCGQGFEPVDVEGECYCAPL